VVNIAFVMGRLGQAPELHYTPQGTPYCRLRIATNRLVNGERYTDWHDVVAWQTLGLTCAKALSKGEVVHVEGRLQTEAREQDGHKQQRTRIVALRVQFLGTGHKSGSAEGGAEAAPGEEEEPS
jgi:single-strand DNA-binding protein